MPMWYYQYVDAVRPDLLGLFPLIVRQPGYGDVVRVVDSALGSGRPVFLIKPMPGLELKYLLEQQGPLVRVVASHMGRQPNHPLDIQFGEPIRLIGFDQVRASEDTVEITLFWECAQRMEGTYSSFVHLVDDAGDTVAGHDHQPGGVYYPTARWEPGEVLLDTHVVSVPPGVAGGEYQLMAGLYERPSMEPLGQERALGPIAVRD
jgi:hypothetical protein